MRQKLYNVVDHWITWLSTTRKAIKIGISTKTDETTVFFFILAVGGYSNTQTN